MATNDGGPAFPSGTVIKGGMSLRDYMAAKAMQAMVANPETCTSEASVEGAAKVIAHWAYIQADAMLAAREAKP